MSAFDELAAADVDLLTASETVPRRILEEAVDIADDLAFALRAIADGHPDPVAVAQEVLHGKP